MQEIIDFTKNLVQFKTMHSKPGEIRQCATYIEHYLKGMGVSYNRFEYGNTPAILALPQNGKAPVLLMSHLDVVDAPDRLFRPVMQDGKLYGRGCFDDKYAVALSLVLLKNNLHQLRKQGRGQKELPFGILITSDEEIGGFNGANDSRFLSQFGIKGIVWGADGNRSQHAPNEHVNIESVYELYALLDAFIKRCESPARIC